ncbi:MAG: hypothetical protein JRI85_15485 [Deltaproteobacteria bacterium]|nr:hypothetical protein [Deltaproteobacteria bacterium]
MNGFSESSHGESTLPYLRFELEKVHDLRSAGPAHAVAASQPGLVVNRSGL